MSIIEQGVVNIELLDDEAFGLSNSSNKKVKIPFVLPNETVRYTKHQYRNKTNFILDEVVSPSDHRIEAPCQYFTLCGGCKLQHADKEIYTSYKSSLISEKIKKISPSTKIVTLELVPISSRRRVQLEFVKKEETAFLGFRVLNSHKIINIDNCLVASKEISNLIIPLRELLFEVMENHSKGSIYILHAENGISIKIQLDKGSFLENCENIIENFVQNNLVISFIGDNHVFKAGNPVVRYAGIDVDVTADCFLQSSKYSDEFLAKKLTDYIIDFKQQKKHDIVIADLFCGRGTLTIPISFHAKIKGFESNQDAINALGLAMTRNKLNISLVGRDLFEFPLSSKELKEFDLVVINPPRAGAKEQVKQLATGSVERIIYVSCNPKTFATDAEHLCASGYLLEQIIPFDQFLYSSHLEVIGFFKKGP